MNCPNDGRKLNPLPNMKFIRCGTCGKRIEITDVSRKKPKTVSENIGVLPENEVVSPRNVDISPEVLPEVLPDAAAAQQAVSPGNVDVSPVNLPSTPVKHERKLDEPNGKLDIY